MLYVATGSGVVQFAINGVTGTLTSQGTISAGSPPYAMAATPTTLYVGNWGSGDVSVFSIDATTGSLTSAQTATVAAVNTIQIDPAGKFLFTGSRVSGTVQPQVCAYAIQPNGTLGAGPSCVTVNGVPQSMVVSGGVLFVVMNTLPPPGTGNTNVVTAFTVGPTGALAPRGQPLDVGAANTGSMGLSIDGKFLFLPRQGQFNTITSADPMVSSGTTPVTGSPACVWAPAAGGTALADPRGGALYVSDPIGLAVGSPQGARVTQLSISASGALTPAICATVGGKPIAMAIYTP
jgi:hypothetical protein